VYFDLSNKKAADASIITVNTCITRESHWGPISHTCVPIKGRYYNHMVNSDLKTTKEKIKNPTEK